MKDFAGKIQKCETISDDDYNKDDECMEIEEDTPILSKHRKVVRIQIPIYRYEGSSTKKRKGSASTNTQEGGERSGVNDDG